MKRVFHYRCILSLNILLFLTSNCLGETNLGRLNLPITDLSQLISYSTPKSVPKNRLVIESYRKGEVAAQSTEPSKKGIIGCELDRKAEKAHIAGKKSLVNRTGKTLTIKMPATPAIFTSYRKKAEGGGAEYIYSGLLDNTEYHKVEVDYANDSPGIYLLNVRNGSILYANAGEHTMYYIQDRIILVNNSPTPPFGIVVVHLLDSGHEIELSCVSRMSGGPNRSGDFEGWDNKLYGKLEAWETGPEPRFQLSVKFPKPGGSAIADTNPVPVRFSYSSGKWHINVPKSNLEELSSRFSCW